MDKVIKIAGIAIPVIVAVVEALKEYKKLEEAK